MGHIILLFHILGIILSLKNVLKILVSISMDVVFFSSSLGIPSTEIAFPFLALTTWWETSWKEIGLLKNSWFVCVSLDGASDAT